MAKGETYVQWGGNYADDFLTLHPYTVWDSVDLGRGTPGDPYGITTGENIGVWDQPDLSIPYLPTVPMGTGVGITGWGTGLIGTQGTILSAVAQSATGAIASYPVWSQESATIDESEVVSIESQASGRPPEDWDAFYEAYEALNSEGTEEAEGDTYRGVIPGDPYEDPGANMAWTDVLLGAIDILDDGTYGNLGTPQAFAPPTSLPTTVGPTGTAGAIPGQSNLRYNPRTGRWECRRRRRRRLLTESDFNDLMRIATLPNKQNVTVALAKAVGRR